MVSFRNNGFSSGTAKGIVVETGENNRIGLNYKRSMSEVEEMTDTIAQTNGNSEKTISNRKFFFGHMLHYKLACYYDYETGGDFYYPSLV